MKKKFLVFVIIGLFIGASMLPSISGNIFKKLEKNNDVKEDLISESLLILEPDLEFLDLQKQLFKVSATIINNGNFEANDIYYEIGIDNGNYIFLNGFMNGSINSIQVADAVTIESELFLALGKVDIYSIVHEPNFGTAGVIATCFAIGPILFQKGGGPHVDWFELKYPTILFDCWVKTDENGTYLEIQMHVRPYEFAIGFDGLEFHFADGTTVYFTLYPEDDGVVVGQSYWNKYFIIRDREACPTGVDCFYRLRYNDNTTLDNMCKLGRCVTPSLNR